MRVTAPPVTIKDIWDAATALYGVAGSYGLLIETNLDSKVSLAKADLTTLEARLSAARALLLDEITAVRLAELNAANMPADLDVVKADTPYLADAALPGTPTAGSIGALVKTNLNAPVGSIPTAPALASSWTAALATVLGNYTAARAAYLDNLSVGPVAQAAAYRVPCFKYQAPATLAQVNPVAGTQYTVLDTTPNVRLLFINLSHNDTVTPRELQVTITIDGQSISGQVSPGTGNVVYYPSLTMSQTGAVTLTLGTTVVPLSLEIPLEGHSVRVTARMYVAFAAGKILYCNAIYEKLE